jgi:hypothetical protein
MPQKELVPKYAGIKVQITSKASHSTQAKVGAIRIKDEIKFLYRKKDLLNKKLYQIHLQAAQEWGNTWYTIRDYIHNDIIEDLNRKHNTLKQKLNRLEHTQTSTPKHLKTFYPRVTNNTDIKFTTDELDLLNKGQQTYTIPGQHHLILLYYCILSITFFPILMTTMCNSMGSHCF